MANKRYVDEKPTFSLIQKADEMKQTLQEIIKFKPKTEISLEGSGDIAQARIIDWEPARKLITVKWLRKSESFENKLESNSELRSFFKVNLFTKVVVFKSTTLRRLPDGTYHYRIPEQIFQHQLRSALRVPIDESLEAMIVTPIGNFKLLDLSVGGAKLSIDPLKKINLEKSIEYPGVSFLIPGYPLLSSIKFTLKVTHLDPQHAGSKFINVTKNDQSLIKQFLVEALQIHYKKTLIEIKKEAKP